MTDRPEHPAPPFAIFRAGDANDYTPEGPMQTAPLTEVQQSGMAALAEAGMLEGSRVKLLYKRPGMSLTYVWFKSGFPLPLHSHSTDCLYFIIAGTLKIGKEELGPGDGFFLGTDVPYSYLPGPDGVEVLEFRTSDSYDFKAAGKSAAYWQTALSGLLAAKDTWDSQEKPPSGLAIG